MKTEMIDWINTTLSAKSKLGASDDAIEALLGVKYKLESISTQDKQPEREPDGYVTKQDIFIPIERYKNNIDFYSDFFDIIKPVYFKQITEVKEEKRCLKCNNVIKKSGTEFCSDNCCDEFYALIDNFKTQTEGKEAEG